MESPFQLRTSQAQTPDLAAQYGAVREGAALFDFSAMTRLTIEGADAIRAVDSLITRNIAHLPEGGVAYSAFCNPAGKMLVDCVVMHAGSGSVLYCGSSEDAKQMIVEKAAAMQASVRDVTGETGFLAVQGPRSRELLAALANKDISGESFPYFTCRNDIELAGIPVLMARLGYTAELGFELQVDADRAVDLWDAIMFAEAAAQPRLATAAIRVVAIEGGFLSRGAEYDETVSPYECGLGWTVDEGKPDFVGREEVLRDKEATRSRLGSVVIDGDPEAVAGGGLVMGDEEVGVITRATASPLLGGKTLGLARVAKEHLTVGNVLAVGLPGGATCTAEVVSHPQYDPQRERAKRG